jgi:methylenetetrahydrofolate reductase (NADPH)
MAETITSSKLEKVLKSGQQAVTSECGPPRSSDASHVIEKGHLIKEHVDAINVTDNQTSVTRLCSLAACIHLKQQGFDPVLQMVVRDRNRIALQADILGAASFGINNILCLSGDHQSFGDSPQASNVFDLDSMQLVQTVRHMRDEGKFLSGDEIKQPPSMFVGAAANPFGDPYKIRVPRLAKKINCGAEFIQTQCIYNVDKFETWMKDLCERGLEDQVYILAGITPMRSVGMARYLQKNVPGMDVPDELIERLKGVEKNKQSDEGITIAVETIQRLKEVKGVAGFHVMAIEWEEKVPEIVERSGLYPRPRID